MFGSAVPCILINLNWLEVFAIGYIRVCAGEIEVIESVRTSP